MPSPADDTLRMLQAGGYVAAVVVPVAVACGWIARSRLGSVCPRWRTPPFVWPGLAIFAWFLADQFAPLFIPLVDWAGFYNAVYPTGFPSPPADAAPGDATAVRRTLQAIWLSLGSVPSLLFAAIMVRSLVFRRPVPWAKEVQQLPRTVALGTLGWATFGVLAVALHVGLVFLFDALGWPITEHPLARMGPNGDGYGGLLLTLSACVVAPLREEFLFRGLLVPWAGGRWFRPWSLLCAAAVMALLLGLKADGTFHSPAVAFVLVLAVGAYAIQRLGPRWPKFPARTALAVWSSSALFAAAHSSVWPTPIPLFVLALGLGYLAARTRSWAASAVTHILFNAVSTVWVFLRG
jgi:membrane protease YdiL (CAAX protease family)